MVDAVAAAVDEFAGLSQVVPTQGVAYGGLLVPEEARENPSRNVGTIGEIGVVEQRQIEIRADLAVVVAAGELNEAASLEALAVRPLLVA